MIISVMAYPMLGPVINFNFFGMQLSVIDEFKYEGKAMKQDEIEGSLDFENITPTEGLKEYIRNTVTNWWRTQAKQRALFPSSYEIWFSRQLLQYQVVCEMRVYGEDGDFWEGIAVDRNVKQALDQCLSGLIYYQYQEEGTCAYRQRYSAIYA